MMILSFGNTTPNLKHVFAGISRGQISGTLASTVPDINPTPNLRNVLSGISEGRIRITVPSSFSGISPQDVHEAINYALGTVRVVVTPSGDPWNVSQKMFDRMIDLALQKLADIDPASAGTVSRYDMGVYIIGRGYKASLPPPEQIRAALPAPIKDVPDVVPDVPTIVIDPPIYIPRIHRVAVKQKQPEPQPRDYDRVLLPSYLAPPPTKLEPYIPPTQIAPTPTPTPVPGQYYEPEPYYGPPEDYPLFPDPGIRPTGKRTEQDIDYNTILWVVGALVGGVLLSGMGRQSGDRYAR